MLSLPPSSCTGENYVNVCVYRQIFVWWASLHVAHTYLTTRLQTLQWSIYILYFHQHLVRLLHFRCGVSHASAIFQHVYSLNGEMINGDGFALFVLHRHSPLLPESWDPRREVRWSNIQVRDADGNRRIISKMPIVLCCYWGRMSGKEIRSWHPPAHHPVVHHPAH